MPGLIDHVAAIYDVEERGHVREERSEFHALFFASALGVLHAQHLPARSYLLLRTGPGTGHPSGRRRD